MDTIDKKMLALLDENPKMPATKIGKTLRISQQVASYRLQKMIEQKVIAQCATIINLKALKQEHYRIFLTYTSTKYSNEEIFSYLRAKKGVCWAARIGGKYDLHIALFVYDFAAYDAFLSEFNQKFKGLVKDVKSCYVVRYQFFRHKYLSTPNETLEYGYDDPPVAIDDLDRKILQRIKKNCRLPALKIADNTSYKTIINRIKRLEKERVILGYRLMLPAREYKSFIVLFSYNQYSYGEEKKLMGYCRQRKEITQFMRMFGTWQSFLQVRARSVEDVQELVIVLRNRFSSIAEYEIIPVFETIELDMMPL